MAAKSWVLAAGALVTLSAMLVGAVAMGTGGNSENRMPFSKCVLLKDGETAKMEVAPLGTLVLITDVIVAKRGPQAVRGGYVTIEREGKPVMVMGPDTQAVHLSSGVVASPVFDVKAEYADVFVTVAGYGVLP